MITQEEVKNKLISELKRYTYPIRTTGGQQCGMPPTGITLECEHTGFKISISEYRSQYQNVELALTIYKLYLDEVIR